MLFFKNLLFFTFLFLSCPPISVVASQPAQPSSSDLSASEYIKDPTGWTLNFLQERKRRCNDSLNNLRRQEQEKCNQLQDENYQDSEFVRAELTFNADSQRRLRARLEEVNAELAKLEQKSK